MYNSVNSKIIFYLSHIEIIRSINLVWPVKRDIVHVATAKLPIDLTIANRSCAIGFGFYTVPSFATAFNQYIRYIHS